MSEFQLDSADAIRQIARTLIAPTKDDIARAICAETCAFYGEPSCFQIRDDQNNPLPWPNPNCDEPGCQAQADAVLALLRKSTLSSDK